MAQAMQVERVLVHLIRDAQPAAQVDEPERHAHRGRERSRRPEGLVRVGHQRIRVEHVRGTERVEPQQPEMWRRGRAVARRDEIRRVHPELPGSVVADQAHPFEAGSLADGHPQEDGNRWRALAAGGGQRLQPRQLVG